MAATFEITGGPADGIGGLAVGPWRTRTGSATPALPANIGHTSGRRDHVWAEALPCWQVDFTGTRIEARAALDAGARSLDDAAARIEALPRCVEQALRERIAPACSPETLADFAVAAGEGAEAAGALERILDFATAHARVETRIRGVLYARSVMHLAGDTQMVLAFGLDPEHARMHAHAVSLAVRSRDLWVRLIAMVFQSSARIAAAGLGPVGMAGALPQVWRLTRRLLADTQELRQVHAARVDANGRRA